MIQISKRKDTGNVSPVKQQNPNEQLLENLSLLCARRFHAISCYPYAVGAKEKFAAIEAIRYNLKAAAHCMPVEQYRVCLGLDKEFKAIAPRRTQKLLENYIKKVNFYMNICRAKLGREVQS